MKKIFCILALALLCGCVNLTYHIGNEVDGIYEPTKIVFNDGVCIWWNERMKSKYPVESTFIKFTWLFWVVDCPCECVFDTITLPYDYFKK